MLQAVWSFVAVLLLVAMGFLVYSGRAQDSKIDNGLTATATPPLAPTVLAPTPAAPIQAAPVQATPPARTLPLAQPPAIDEPEIKPVKKAKRTHVVQTGDSLSSISRKYYGTPDYYTKLADANALRSRDHIRVGQVLVLPDLPVVAESAAKPETEIPTEEAQISNQDFVPQPPTLNTTAPKP